MEGELTQAKQQLEKLYTSSKKTNEHIFHQRDSYDLTCLRYLIEEKSEKK